MKHLFNWTSIFGTIFIFLFLWGISKIGVQFEFLNVFEQVFENFTLSDYYYTLRGSDIKHDDRVVIVNIGDESREVTAKQIEILNKYEPKVIAIDAFFRKLKPEFSQDSALAASIQQTENFVLVSELVDLDSASNTWGGVVNSHEFFQQHAHAGYANTITEEDAKEYFNTWKKIKPKQKVKGREPIPCFAAKVVEFYDKAKYDKFMKRGNEVENIYFRGNTPSRTDELRGFPAAYTTLDVEQILFEQFEPDVIKDKIVLLGYMGTEYTSKNWDGDKFFTPLNKEPLGRTYPDMYGVVVHANIISMILDENYIDVMSPYLGIALAIILCYLNVALFVFILKKKRLAPWYGGISKIIQLLEVVFLVFLTVYFFGSSLYKADTTLAMLAILVSGDLAEIYLDVMGNIFHTHKVEH
ncbi:MAG: CHASE2 domain-containing protein [Flammeovirgaceae bacterium]